MKIHIRVPYRNGGWIAFGCLLLLAFLCPLTVTLIRSEQYGGTVICVALALILLHGAWRRLSYGFRINEKRVVLLSRRHKRVIPYDTVREMVVTFHQESVAVRVITQDEEIVFVWEEMVMDSKTIFPGRGWGSNDVPVRVGIRMTERFVENCTERLSQCEKVRIENFYLADE